MPNEIDSGDVVRIVRRFAAPPERVFRAFVDAAEVPWMWAGIGQNPRAEVDLRIGGRYRIAIEPPAGEGGWRGTGEAAMSGVYLEIEPPNRLVYTLHWEADVGYNAPGADVVDEAVIVDLASDRDGTTMTYLHLGIPDDGVSAATHARGTEAALDLLERLVVAPSLED